MTSSPTPIPHITTRLISRPQALSLLTRPSLVRSFLTTPLHTPTTSNINPVQVQLRQQSGFGPDWYNNYDKTKAQNEGKEGSQQKGPEEPKKGGDIEATSKKYGKYAGVGLAVYFGVYLVTLASVFGIVYSGAGLTAEEIIKKIEESEWVPQSIKDLANKHLVNASPLTVNFVAAWLLTKLTEPLRVVVTAAIVAKMSKKGMITAKSAGLPLAFITTTLGSQQPPSQQHQHIGASSPDQKRLLDCSTFPTVAFNASFISKQNESE